MNLPYEVVEKEILEYSKVLKHALFKKRTVEYEFFAMGKIYIGPEVVRTRAAFRHLTDLYRSIWGKKRALVRKQNQIDINAAKIPGRKRGRPKKNNNK